MSNSCRRATDHEPALLEECRGTFECIDLRRPDIHVTTKFSTTPEGCFIGDISTDDPKLSVRGERYKFRLCYDGYCFECFDDYYDYGIDLCQGIAATCDSFRPRDCASQEGCYVLANGTGCAGIAECDNTPTRERCEAKLGCFWDGF